ncbi:MAG: serine/threonine protein kinase [Candidatus Heimdallarchaeota archaeon]|nr:MAG: serine/threonine protein kinase [Candidatus Heimdallarchaeota archaeon]
MPLTILEFFRELTPFDFRILSVIEVLMARHEIVPTEEIAAYLHYTEKKVQKALNRLLNYKLIFLAQRHYQGAALTFSGYDALALKALVEKGTIDQIGPEVGAGKESDIRLAVDDEGNEFIVKTHRLGKLDFRATKRARAFIAEKSHTSPLYESRLSAEREFKALSELFKAGVSVPNPIAQNRHVVAMHIIIGQDLYRIKKNEFQSDEEILTLFNNIILEMQKAVKQGYIHGDLSEYNIRLNEENYPVFFDWPQYIETESEQAERILTRDLSNILNYFKKKFQMTVKTNLSELLLKYFDNWEFQSVL